MKDRLKKIAPWVGYPVFYLFAFIVFALLTFPYDKLKERVVASYNASQRETNGHDELSIGEMSGYWLTGVKMKDVKLLSASTDPSLPPTELKIDEATLRFGILSLLVGNQNVGFHLKAFDGEIDGNYLVASKDRSLDCTLVGLDLGQVEPVASMIGLPVEGKLDGTIKLTMPDGKASKGSGAVSLEAKDFAVGDGKAKLKGALPLPRLSVGSLALVAEAKDGALKITKLAAGGKDLELAGDGRVQLHDIPAESICDINLRFKFNDGYRTKNDITKSLFGAPGSATPPLFELADPKVKAAKRPDGFYGWNVRGVIGHPDFVPGSGAGGPSALPGAPALPGLLAAPKLPQ